MKLWHATTYRLENTLDYRMERVWGIGYLKVRPGAMHAMRCVPCARMFHHPPCQTHSTVYANPPGAGSRFIWAVRGDGLPTS